MSAIVTILAKRTLRDAAAKNFTGPNPYDEEYQVLDRQGNPTGKTKKRKRGYPSGLSANDIAILKKVRKRAYRLDNSMSFCGVRFGWSSLVGLIPFLGDVLDCLMAYMLLRTAGNIDGGLPPSLRARMLLNVALDFGMGLVPFVGDIADTLYRANTRNAWLLEVYLTKRAEAERLGRLPDEEGRQAIMPEQSTRAKTPSNPAGGLLGGGRTRRPDEEMATGITTNGGKSRPK